MKQTPNRIHRLSLLSLPLVLTGLGILVAALGMRALWVLGGGATLFAVSALLWDVLRNLTRKV